MALRPTPLFTANATADGPGADDTTGARILEAKRLRPPQSSYDGEVESDSLLIASLPPGGNWRLRVGRSTYRPIALRSLIDAAGTVRTGTPFSGFSVAGSSTGARLVPHRPFNVTMQLLLLSALWILASAFVLGERRRERQYAAGQSALPETGTDEETDAEDDRFTDDAFGDDGFDDPFISTRRAVAVAPDDLPVDGSVSDELWNRFAERRREESDDPGERS